MNRSLTIAYSGLKGQLDNRLEIDYSMMKKVVGDKVILVVNGDASIVLPLFEFQQLVAQMNQMWEQDR